MTQLDLLSFTPAPAKPRALTIEERYQLFHAANPQVFAEMLRLARARLDRGEKYISVKALWEELRRSLIQIAQRKEAAYEGFDALKAAYKLNNSYTALYARELLDIEPRLAGVIETRKRKAK
jgi:predicted kinase